MRIKSVRDEISFKDCEEFGITEVVADFIGPLIDISNIKEFSGIEDVRYLTEKEICEKLSVKGGTISFKVDDIRRFTKEALRHRKLAIRYIDADMVMQLCRAKSFCSIKIISTVPDVDLYEQSKNLLIDFTKQMVKYNSATSKSKGYMELEEGDFEHIDAKDSDLPGILLYAKKQPGPSSSYRIGIDDDALVFSTFAEKDKDIPSFQEWIGGIREQNPAKRLSDVLDKRKHIHDGVADVLKMCSSKTIELKEYTILEKYYVFDKNLKNQLQQRIDSIQYIIKTGKAKTKPICVFLAGTPGTGKSFFVKCFAKAMSSEKHYPVTSLSGVSSENFYDAIEHHVEQVYNAKYSNEETAAIAFLDEIDTASDYFAFRFLMDAMTGSRTNDKGVAMESFKSGTVENLIWFFAGSAGATRQEFMDKIENNERKVIDFFDRIHFDMQLPAVEVPGQAVLTLMSAIEEYWDELPECISIKVLLAFACTRWTSTRSIMTICRAAAAHRKADEAVVTLDLFQGIDTSEEFHKQCIYIGEHVHDNRMIKIEWMEEKKSD